MRAIHVLSCWLAMSAVPTLALAWEPFRSENSEVVQGNAHLAKGQIQEALSAYNEAAKRLPNEPGVHLDRGLALLKAGKLPEAREALRIAGQGNASPEIRAKANYNLGLAFLQEAEAAAKQEQGEEAQKLLRESADAFKSSLRASPKNRDAAWNFELAKRRLVEQEKKDQEKKEQEKKEQEEKDQEKKEQEQQDDQQKQDGDQEKPEQQQDGGQDKPDDPQDAKDGEDAGAPEPEEPKGEDAGADSQPEPKQPEPEQGKEQEQPSEAQPAMPEHMQKALDALEDSEENLQKHRAALRARQRPRRIEKDW